MPLIESSIHLTKNQVDHFVKDKLNLELFTIQEPCQQNLDYLNQIIKAFLNKIPFHNFTFMSQPPEKRTLPTIPEVIGSVLSGHGGLCWTNNTALFFILEALGFSVYMVNASVNQRGANNHVIVMAENVVETGDTYLVEAGLGHPSFCAVNLDFNEESETISASFNTYKYVKRGEEFIRLNKTSRSMKRYPLVEGDWSLVCFFKLEKLDFEEIQSVMKKSYDNPEFGFRKCLRAVSFKNHIATAMKTEEGKEVVTLQENSKKNLELLKKYDMLTEKEELGKHLNELFPMVPVAAINMAIENFIKL